MQLPLSPVMPWPSTAAGSLADPSRSGGSKMARLVQGKIVMVTGGGSNIGRATALKLAREGVKVMIADYVQERGERIIKMIKDSGGSASFVQTDVSIASQVEAMVTKPSRFTGESM